MVKAQASMVAVARAAAQADKNIKAAADALSGAEEAARKDPENQVKAAAIGVAREAFSMVVAKQQMMMEAQKDVDREYLEFRVVNPKQGDSGSREPLANQSA